MCPFLSLLYNLVIVIKYRKFKLGLHAIGKSYYISTKYLSLRITVPSASKLRFMWQPSFNLVPADNDWDARSLPARSTKFCITIVKSAFNYKKEKEKQQNIFRKTERLDCYYNLSYHKSCKCAWIVPS